MAATREYNCRQGIRHILKKMTDCTFTHSVNQVLSELQLGMTRGLTVTPNLLYGISLNKHQDNRTEVLRTHLL
jgi:hypothetical protein